MAIKVDETEAEENTTGNAAAEKAAKQGGKNVFAVIAAGVVLAAGAVGAVWVLVIQKKKF